MRSLLLTGLSLSLLGGCSTGYVIDRLRPKTFLIGPQLARYGLSPQETQCVGQKLGKELDVWQLRQLATSAGAIKPGGSYPAELGSRELQWAAASARDSKVASVMEAALRECSANEEALVQTGLTELPPPSGAPGEPAASAEPTPPQNGPAGYQPSESLWAAFEAHEKGNHAEAARLARIAAEQGDSAAQQFLGALYASGQGVKKDLKAAAKWYWLAAEQGWSEAMNNLGKAYQAGAGVERNAVQALKWYLLAGNRPSEDTEVIQRNIESVTVNMTPEELAEAGRLAREWERAHRR